MVAWLGLDEVRAQQPVLIGDSIRVEAELVVTRLTKKADRGIWTFSYTVRNQRSEPVMTFQSSFMIRRRDS